MLKMPNQVTVRALRTLSHIARAENQLLQNCRTLRERIVLISSQVVSGFVEKFYPAATNVLLFVIRTVSIVRHACEVSTSNAAVEEPHHERCAIKVKKNHHSVCASAEHCLAVADISVKSDAVKARLKL